MFLFKRKITPNADNPKEDFQSKSRRRGSVFQRFVAKVQDVDDGSSISASVETAPVDNGISSTKKAVYLGPVMPNMGKPVNYALMVERNENVRNAMETMMTYVMRDIKQSIDTGKSIPVTKDIERITVSQDVLSHMKQIQTNTDVRNDLRKNFEDIQRTLIYRKSALEMMNSNYSDVLVRKIDKIYVNESRNITEYK